MFDENPRKVGQTGEEVLNCEVETILYAVLNSQVSRSCLREEKWAEV